jgi:malonyl-CoA/methylmalonyl-CoA synthetase
MANPLFDTFFGQHVGKDAVFLQLPGDETITYAAFLQTTARYAGLLQKLGLKPGDRLAVQIAKSPQALAVYAGCVQAGVVFLPLNTAYTADEVSYFVENSGAKVLLCDQGSAAALAPVAKAAGAALETLNEDGSGTFSDKAEGLPDQFETVTRSEDDLAAFLYTSGTTGRSKGAMLTQNNLLSNAQVLKDEWQFTAQDVLLHALPIFHTHGLFVATNTTLLAGGKMIFLPRFTVDEVLAQLPNATTMMGVPTFYTRLLGDARFTKKLVEHMRLFVSGSAPLLAETHVQFEKRTGCRILERYGMTETNMNTSNPYSGERRAGTVGFPLPGTEVKITDRKTGATLPQGEIGEIEVRGPNVFKGYWQMPEKTAEELRDDGFFITGDLGQLDEEGYLKIVGRNKDLIISGGYNIYPKEIELLLDEEEHVLESAVIGVPHPDFGETVVGILVPDGNIDPNLEKIKTNISKSLARFKHPKMLIMLPELPRNTMGKVQKKQLRDQFKDLFTAG